MCLLLLSLPFKSDELVDRRNANMLPKAISAIQEDHEQIDGMIQVVISAIATIQFINVYKAFTLGGRLGLQYI